VDGDQCFLHDAPSALERRNETTDTNPQAFKDKVALSAIRLDLTMVDLVMKYDVRAN
jgi:hypothetical protein